MIGTVDTSEFAVSVAASIGFFLGLGSEVLDLQVVTALLAGGVIAAPIAAARVRVIPPRVLGAAVGGGHRPHEHPHDPAVADLEADLGWAVYALVATLWVSAVAFAVTRHRRERSLDQAGSDVDEQAGARAERQVPDPV